MNNDEDNARDADMLYLTALVARSASMWMTRGNIPVLVLATRKATKADALRSWEGPPRTAPHGNTMGLASQLETTPQDNGKYAPIKVRKSTQGCARDNPSVRKPPPLRLSAPAVSRTRA